MDFPLQWLVDLGWKLSEFNNINDRKTSAQFKALNHTDVNWTCELLNRMSFEMSYLVPTRTKTKYLEILSSSVNICNQSIQYNNIMSTCIKLLIICYTRKWIKKNTQDGECDKFE